MIFLLFLCTFHSLPRRSDSYIILFISPLGWKKELRLFKKFSIFEENYNFLKFHGNCNFQPTNQKFISRIEHSSPIRETGYELCFYTEFIQNFSVERDMTTGSVLSLDKAPKIRANLKNIAKSLKPCKFCF